MDDRNILEFMQVFMNRMDEIAESSQRQAAALEQQKEYTGQIVGQLANLEKWYYNLHEQAHLTRIALERIAAVLERADNLSKMFGGEA
jgi:hypothetical protein